MRHLQKGGAHSFHLRQTQDVLDRTVTVNVCFFGQKRQIEATYSQDKRRFGSQIAASSTRGQYYEVLLRALVPNLAILLRLQHRPAKLFSTEHNVPIFPELRSIVAAAP